MHSRSIWRCVLKNLVQSTQNCNTVSRQRIRDVSSRLVGVHRLKIGHCRNLFLVKLNNLNVVIILSRATFPSVKATSCSVTLTKFAIGLYTQSNTLKSNQTNEMSYWHRYVKTKNWSYTRSKVLNPVQHLFQASTHFHAGLLGAVAYISKP